MRNKWYSVHTVTLAKYRTGPQNDYPLWENVLLIQAKDVDDAATQAKAIAIESYAYPDESYTCNGRPAETVFVGIRKIIKLLDSRIFSGIEVTHLELCLNSEKELFDLMNRKRVALKFDDAEDDAQ